MNIQPSNNTSFKSKIKVLHINDFDKVTDMLERSGNCKYISNYRIVPKSDYPCFYGYRQNIKKAYTNDIRSCTAGLVADVKKKIAPLFFHLYDCVENIDSASVLADIAKGSNAFIAGSKDKYQYSTPLFEKLKQIIRDKKIPMTILQALNLYWQAHLAYDSESDSVYLSVEKQGCYIPKSPTCVKSMTELKEVFKHVCISPVDTVEFYKEGELDYL